MTYPLGFQAAKADWNRDFAGRDMTLDDWNSLTFGEQAGYADQEQELMIHVRHLRAARMCNREPRLWFARHGLSWTEFVTIGIPVSRILATNDALALPVVEVARKEAADVNR